MCIGFEAAAVAVETKLKQASSLDVFIHLLFQQSIRFFFFLTNEAIL